MTFVQFLVIGILFYFLGYVAGYSSGRTKRLNINVTVMKNDGNQYILEQEIDWDNEFKKIREKKDGF